VVEVLKGKVEFHLFLLWLVIQLLLSYRLDPTKDEPYLETPQEIKTVKKCLFLGFFKSEKGKSIT